MANPVHEVNPARPFKVPFGQYKIDVALLEEA
jgi:hypothetical protein